MWDNEDVIDLSAGQVVADKYRIDGVIGAGGMGVVIAATRLELDQRVAIKLLREASPEAIARFQREARLIVRLKSAHVARVFDIGTLDDETPFIVMELLEGEDLSRVLSKRGRLPVEQAVDYVLEACEAVAEAHTLGMVHRDLKPANLFVARGPGGRGSVKVLDFGISKHLAAPGANDVAGDLTNEGVALGSPGYMSPEQITSSRDVDVRADIYSLGAILYRLVSGEPPYRGDSLMSVLASMASAPLAPLHSLVPDVPPRFAAIVERCLAQSREERPASVAELAQVLAPFGSHRARASTEQILATMGVEPAGASETIASAPISVPDDRGLGAMMETAPGATIPKMSATIVSPLAPPPMSPLPPMSPAPMAVSSPSHPPMMVSGDLTPARVRVGRSANLLPAFAAVALLAGTAAWVSFRRSQPAHVDGARPRSSEVAPSVATALPAAPVTPTASLTAVVIAPPSVESAAPAPPTPPEVAPKPKPTPKAQPRHTGTGHRADPSAPPNPNEVPGGRR